MTTSLLHSLPLLLALTSAAPQGEESAPPALFTLDAATSLTPGRDLAHGIASPEGPRNAFKILREAVGEGGIYRRTLLVHMEEPHAASDVEAAATEGRKIWLTVTATPLDLATNLDGETYSTGLPPFARSTPSDPVAWADRAIERIDKIIEDTGVTPHYIEIWNEPDRREWYDGTLADYLDLYQKAAERLRGAYPGTRIGGMALAGHQSTMGGSESALFALAEHCATVGAPLDFLSWHHYAPSTDLLTTGIVGLLRTRLQSLGLAGVQLAISEWNLASNPEFMGNEFDGSHAAAMYAGFVASAVEAGLDVQIFFQMLDVDALYEISDFAGVGMGLLTQHGIKKPVFHALDLVRPMLEETRVSVTGESEEFSVKVFATQTPHRMRLTVSNDSVPFDYVWASQLRMRGIEEVQAFTDRFMAAWAATGLDQPTAEDLALHGLTLEEAEAGLEAYALAERARLSFFQDREVQLRLLNLPAGARLGRTWVLDSERNAPATRVEEIQPQLVSAERKAKESALEAVAEYLSRPGQTVTLEDFRAAGGVEQWLTQNGVSQEHWINALAVYRETMIDERLANEVALNSLPATALTTTPSEEADVFFDPGTGLLTATMERNALLVLEIEY